MYPFLVPLYQFILHAFLYRENIKEKYKIGGFVESLRERESGVHLLRSALAGDAQPTQDARPGGVFTLQAYEMYPRVFIRLVHQ